MKAYRINQTALVGAIMKELGRQHPGLPADNRMSKVVEAANLICAEFEREPVASLPAVGFPAWLGSDDTGASSLFMASVLSHRQIHAEKAYPRDPDDLGRCIRLLRAVPEFADRLHLMSSQGPQWAAVVANWEQWTRMYNNENDDGSELYDAMQAAYAGVTHA
ncbi:hypothetical protein A8O28_04400 [Enterobacteriaceae bacterium CCUG 67584]|nr:hypothetical protein [Enterobacteriaceae bacterium CCUG 67584]